MASRLRHDDEDAIVMLETEHRTVEALHDMFKNTTELDERRRIVRDIVRELSIHAAIEEMIFYPAVRETIPGSDELLDDALAEHQDVKEALRELEKMDVEEDDFDFTLDQILNEVAEHVDEEEQELFPRVRELIDAQRLVEIARGMQQARNLAPTHPHPSAPNEPPGNIVIGGVSGIVDRMRDAVAGALGRS